MISEQHTHHVECADASQPQTSPTPQRVLLVSAFFWPHVGGVENYTQNVARELAAMGHEVVVLTSLLPGQIEHVEAAPEGYLLLRLDSTFLMDDRFCCPVPTAANRTVVAWLESWAPQAVVIGARFYPICVLGAWLAQRVGVVPLIVEHVSAYLTVNDPLRDQALHIYEHAMTQALRRFPAAYFGVSRASNEWLRAFGIRPSGVLSNAIDAERFVCGASPRDFREELGVGANDMLVVFAGRLTSEKGVREAVGAARVLAGLAAARVAAGREQNRALSADQEAAATSRFIIAGEGPLEAEVRAAAEELPNLAFVGKLDETDLAALLLAADAMCLPSRSEGLPTALLEAAATRTVPVITRVGGTDELVPDARFGIVLEDRSVAGVCGALLYLHQNPKVVRSMADRLHERVTEEYSWGKTATELLAASEGVNGGDTPLSLFPASASALVERAEGGSTFMSATGIGVSDADAGCELTILMPCLNEAGTLATCIGKAQAFLRHADVCGEVLVADNGSTDGSQVIARMMGARVVDATLRGYGNALREGIRQARGTYVIMGDADDSYDFRHLQPFLDELRAGTQLVMGNRFAGGIAPGAMPLLHRYVGNPVLSAIGRVLYNAPVHDFHCGLRGFDRHAIQALDLISPGMEYASEMVVQATLHHLRIAEVPTTLQKDGRDRRPHLRTFPDGWRHLSFLVRTRLHPTA